MPSGTLPEGGAQVMAASSDVPSALASSSPPPLTTRIVHRADSDRRTATLWVSCDPSPLGENAPVPSLTSQTRGAVLSRGTSDEPIIQPSTSEVWTR